MPIMEKEKSALTEEKIKELYKKIEENEREDKAFSENLDKFIKSGKGRSSEITVAHTSNALAVCGAKKELDVIIRPDTILKCMSSPENRYHGHDLSQLVMNQLPNQLRNPTMIFKGNQPNSLVAITELKDKEGREIMVAVSLAEQNSRREVNRVSSMYGRNNMTNYLQAQIFKGNLIAANKEKAENMLQSLGLQLPPEGTYFGFDNSIAYTDANVKYPEGKNAEISQFHEPITHDKLIPILNAKANWQEGKLNTLKEKRERQTLKIEQYQSKIDKLTYKAERLEDTNKFLKNLGEKIPAVKALIERNERKIKAIREDKIPNRQNKIQNCKNKISEIDRKSEIRSHKLERCVALSDTVKSFALIGKERRTKFANAMDRLNKSTFNCLCDKRQNVISKQEKVIKEMQLDFKMIGLSQLSAEEKAAKINEVTDKFKSTLEKLDKKISKLKLPENYYGYTPENQLDKLIDNTQKVISESVEKGEVSVAKISEKVCEDNSKLAFELSAEKENPLRNAELAMEENGNMIDGVINNLPAEKSEISDTYVDRITNAVWEKLQGQLKEKNIEYNSVNDKQNSVTVAVNNASKNSFKSEKNKAVENQVAEYLNPEYYKKIAKEDRFTQVMTEEQAREKLAELKADGIEYSAVIKGDKSKVTINQKDFRKSGFSVTKLNEKIAEKTKSEERPQQKNHSRDEQSL